MATDTGSATAVSKPSRRSPGGPQRRAAVTRPAAALGAALAAALLSGAGAGAAVPAGAAPAVGYRQIDLGTLGGQSSFATGINNRGTVVGRAQTPDGVYHGFAWRHGKMTDLGQFNPMRINDRGQIVGTRDDVDGTFLWSRGRLVPLGNSISYPIGINERGQILGQQTGANGLSRPVIWSKGKVRVLPLDTASGINNRGQVSGGRLVDAGGFHASLWYRGKVTDLGAAAFNRSNTYAINSRGWVIGWRFSAQQDERATLWRHGVSTDLGTLGGDSSTAVEINDRGVILLTSHLPDGTEHPALWRRGALTDLSAAGVEGDLAGYNNRGEIAGSIRPVFGTAHAVVYRPKIRTSR